MQRQSRLYPLPRQASAGYPAQHHPAMPVAAWLMAAAVATVLPGTLPREALAQPTAAQSQDLLLDYEPAPGLPDSSALQLALEHELEVLVRLGQPGPGQAALIVRGAGPGRAMVSFAAAGKVNPGRAVTLPAELARAAETIALLAANLMQDDAADLLTTLRKRRIKAVAKLAPTVVEPPSPEPVAAVPVPPQALPVAATPAAADDAGPLVPVAVDVIPGITFPISAGSGGTRKLSFGVFIASSKHLDGVEVASLAALKSGRVRGVQVSGVLNMAQRLDKGAQAGVVNLAGGPAQGIQAGVVNILDGDLQGIQAGTVNVASAIRGVQGGVVNLASGKLEGVQAGTVNIAATARGVQGGVVNVSGSDATGLQVGVFNLAAGKAGWQVGVLNLGKEADVGLGVLSLYWNGRTHLQAWTGTSGQTMVGVKHGSNRIHNLLALGSQPDGAGGHDAVGALGIGVRVVAGDRVTVDLDAQQQLVASRTPPTAGGTSAMHFSTQSQLSALLGLRILSTWRVFGGPTYNVGFDADPNLARADVWWRGGDRTGPGMASVRWTAGDVSVRGWPGLVIGVSWL